MKKKKPLPAKITTGIATIGIISSVLGIIKENGAISIAGLTLTLIGFFASFVVSMIMDIKKTYPLRSDPFQRKMRILKIRRPLSQHSLKRRQRRRIQKSPLS